MIVVRNLGLQPYLDVLLRMQHFTRDRSQIKQSLEQGLVEHKAQAYADELWVLQHYPVFTQGQAGKEEHILAPGDIPVVASDRGGQVTYHGPGQLILYFLCDIAKQGISLKKFIQTLQQTVIEFLVEYGIESHIKAGAPGVYVGGAKISSLGLRVRKGCTYHGLSFNVDMDLAPFARINPCGYAGLKMMQLSDYVKDLDFAEVSTKLTKKVLIALGYIKSENELGEVNFVNN